MFRLLCVLALAHAISMPSLACEKHKKKEMSKDPFTQLEMKLEKDSKKNLAELEKKKSDEQLKFYKEEPKDKHTTLTKEFKKFTEIKDGPKNPYQQPNTKFEINN